ncbi:MAG TPA: DUF2934 domain-containing protein [Lacunisphaera sp.]|nr:DUF2934 domain-containing protein [Lacunisphaera sp.]
MNTPTHDEIARQARGIWQDRGCPTGIDTEIWLEAERQLSETASVAEKSRPGAFADRAKSETAAESMVEYRISPPVSEQEAIKAAQVRQTRTPKQPRQVVTAPKSAENGKASLERARSR